MRCPSPTDCKQDAVQVRTPVWCSSTKLESGCLKWKPLVLPRRPV